MSAASTCTVTDAPPPDLSPDVLAAANIVPATGLATDYLNVFNEAVMLFGLLADMPEILDELTAWEPLSYPEHFRRSGFQARDLAIAAYEAAPAAIRDPFDALSGEIADMIRGAVSDAGRRLAAGEDVSEFVQETCFGLQSAIMILDRMVHGHAAENGQDDIDALFD